ncbi:hypothetical protein Agub_g11423 [Astrephomene gubernaculifera]|uniref:Uncharacterized protein n=1 Tax=Astrephomene gubernaculifera TaxID=47775 RepID=A0AAD3DWP5_9CHLO|nr:hypothetical protein Agub_g11423 [Astrephomene gubernaculifera]
MLKGAGEAQLRKQQLPCVRTAHRLACPVRRTFTIRASAAVALPLQDCSAIQQQAAERQIQQHPAARLVSVGQELVATCAAVTLAKAVLQLVAVYVEKARDVLTAALPTSGRSKLPEDARQQLMNMRKHTRLLAFVLPFARAFAAESLTSVYARTFERAAFGFAKMYLFCLFMRVLLSWFPSIDWNAQPWAFLRLITEPYLQIYRGILPPLFGQLDFTPLFGFLILQDVVELMSPVYTLGHARESSMFWTTSDVMCYFDGH